MTRRYSNGNPEFLNQRIKYANGSVMTRDLDTALLRTFVAAAETASMTAAANAVHRTQGAVSQQIRRLEELLDCKLFVRDRRGLMLTDAGERLLEKARQLLAINDEIWVAMTSRELTGRIRLGVPYDLVITHLPPVLKAFANSYPQVEVLLFCATSPQLADALRDGRIDLALIEQPVGPASGECLSVEPLVWVTARGGEIYRKRPLPISLVCESCAFRPSIFARLREHGLEWRALFENGNIGATLATVKFDLAITAMLATTVPPDLDILPPGSGLPELPSFAINLHLRPLGANAIAQALIGQLRGVFRRQPRDDAEQSGYRSIGFGK